MTLHSADCFSRAGCCMCRTQTRTVPVLWGCTCDTRTAARALCRAALGQPPVAGPVGFGLAGRCVPSVGRQILSWCHHLWHVIVVRSHPEGRSTPRWPRRSARMSPHQREDLQGRGVLVTAMGTRTTACEHCSGAAQGRPARPSLLPVWGPARPMTVTETQRRRPQWKLHRVSCQNLVRPHPYAVSPTKCIRSVRGPGVRQRGALSLRTPDRHHKVLGKRNFCEALALRKLHSNLHGGGPGPAYIVRLISSF